MAAQEETVAEIVSGRAQKNFFKENWTLWKRRPLGLMGLIICTLMVLTAATAELWQVVAANAAGYEGEQPYKYALSAYAQLVPPNGEHFLGGDRYGRDAFTRIVFGAQISLYVGFAVALGAGSIAGLLGVMSAYYGGKIDLIGQRLVDILQAFPGLILAMAIVAILQTFSIEATIVAISVPTLPRMVRVVRSQALSVVRTDYVLAGRTIGATDWRLILRYIIPNSMAPWIIVVTGQLGSAITTEASLSFLGLGVPEPHPSWGGMLNANALDYAELAPHIIIYPGIALSLAVFGFNVFGDALRDVLDPRMKGTR
jgi:peptide/nickel transport system permease protein